MATKKLKILVAAAEVAPIAKVGGLGDVIGALPKALIKLNLDARVIMPFYGVIDKKKYKIKPIKRGIKINDETFSLWRTDLPNSAVPVYLIEHANFADKKIYGGAADGLNGINKFIFFSRAILESAKAINFMPDVIHLNDWHTAPAASLLKAELFFNKTKILFTIHNLANQGITPTGNLMAEGILNAGLINTVSPTYAREILTKQYGAGLEKILAKRKKSLHGVLNGIDTDFFNPRTDKLIARNYSAADPEKKAANKLSLQKQLNLPSDKNTPLVGLVTRFVWQKGVDLITEKFSRLNCQFAFLGTGEKKYEQALAALAKKYPRQFSAQIKFDEKLAHRIYAASDIFLVPSRFEPCGLTQLIAMRYGAVPLARATGGLADTISAQVGFTFKKFGAEELYKTLNRALKVYGQKPPAWRQLQLNGMRQDFSWNKSAEEYLKLYKQLLQ
ncbi:MAG: glycogen/starch synthase [bacterium]|nr:glycogen/starch synthase [bacterium]